MGFLKFVIPFIGGAVTAAAVGVAMQIKDMKEEKTRNAIEVDVEFVERTDDGNDNGDLNYRG